jgi:hypothetical protein
MNLRQLTLVGTAACVLAPWTARGAAATDDDRIAVSADGATLTGTGGGGGGSLGWLHNFDADSLVGAAAEHQALGVARWTFGSLNASLTRGPENQRYSMYAEAHEGAGNDGLRAFHYSIEAVGIFGTYFHRLSVQIEDKQIAVEGTRGNLPKVGVAYLWNPHLQTQASYSSSVSGNLGTHLAAARIDEYNAAVNLFAGAAFGQAAPTIILNFQSGLVQSRYLHEGYVGASKPLPHLRSELTLVADYQNLSGIKHATLTLNYIFHVGHPGGTQ